MYQITHDTDPTRLEEDLDLTPSKARDLLGYLLGTLEPRDHRAGDRRYCECYNPPSAEDMALHVADCILQTHGVEGWCLAGSHTRGVSYCNTGDSYALTIVLGPAGYFYVSGWEDAAIRWPSHCDRCESEGCDSDPCWMAEEGEMREAWEAAP